MYSIEHYSDEPLQSEGLLALMQEEWGTQFQKLNNAERLWMLCKIAETLCEEEPEDDEISSEVEVAVSRSETERTKSDRLNLMEALVHQVKSSGYR